MDIASDIGGVVIELEIGAVGKPIRVVQGWAFAPLTEHHVPGCGVEIRVDGIESWLSQNIGAFYVFVVQIGILVINDLAYRLNKVGCFQSRKASGVIPDDKAVSIGRVIVAFDHWAGRFVERVAGAPEHAKIGHIECRGHTADHVCVLDRIGRGAGVACLRSVINCRGHFVVLAVSIKKQRKSYLFQVAETSNAFAFLFGPGERRQQECSQNRDDGNDNQEFNKSKGSSKVST